MPNPSLSLFPSCLSPYSFYCSQDTIAGMFAHKPKFCENPQEVTRKKPSQLNGSVIHRLVSVPVPNFLSIPRNRVFEDPSLSVIFKTGWIKILPSFSCPNLVLTPVDKRDFQWFGNSRPSGGSCISYDVCLLPIPPVTSAAASANRCWRRHCLDLQCGCRFLLLVRQTKLDFFHLK